MKESLIKLRKCGVPDSESFARDVTVEVRGLMAQLGGIGWDFQDIATALDCGRTTLYSWRTGAQDMPAAKLKRLHAIVRENVRKAAGQ